MNTVSSRLHPLLVLAALAVIVFSIAGVAAIFGRIPGVGAESRPGEPMTQNSTSRDSAPQYAAPSASQNASSGRSSASQRAAPSAYAQAPAPSAYAQSAAPCADCGVIESIRVAQVEGQGSGAGAVAGGVVGGLLGNQIGRGNGRTVATIAGAAGGAYAGNAIEKNMKKHSVFKVTLRMEDGTHRTLSLREQPQYAVGDRVRVANGRITERA